jgi:hypothetical protein
MEPDFLHPEIARLTKKLAEELGLRHLLSDPELVETDQVLTLKRGCRRWTPKTFHSCAGY